MSYFILVLTTYTGLKKEPTTFSLARRRTTAVLRPRSGPYPSEPGCILPQPQYLWGCIFGNFRVHLLPGEALPPNLIFQTVHGVIKKVGKRYKYYTQHGHRLRFCSAGFNGNFVVATSRRNALWVSPAQ